VLRRRHGVARLRQGSANPAVLDSGIAGQVWSLTCESNKTVTPGYPETEEADGDGWLRTADLKIERM